MKTNPACGVGPEFDESLFTINTDIGVKVCVFVCEYVVFTNEHN